MGEDEIRRRVRVAIERRGARETARRLGVTTEPVLRIGGGFGVQRGTLALVGMNIARLDDADDESGTPTAA